MTPEREALKKIFEMPDEDDEWDAVEKFHEARRIAKEAFEFDDYPKNKAQSVSQDIRRS